MQKLILHKLSLVTAHFFPITAHLCSDTLSFYALTIGVAAKSFYNIISDYNQLQREIDIDSRIHYLKPAQFLLELPEWVNSSFLTDHWQWYFGFNYLHARPHCPLRY